VQFGGQTPLNLATELAARRECASSELHPTSSTWLKDRDRFRKMMGKLGTTTAESGMASNLDEALEIAKKIGYPLMVRPSYVLGGRAWR